MDPVNVSAQFEIALPVPEIIAIGVLGAVANPQSWEEEAVGGRDGTVRKALAPHSILSFTRFRDNCGFCASARHFYPPRL